MLLVDRTTTKKAFNYNIKGRKILTYEEIKNAFNTLKFYNQNKKNDIYIKSEVGNFYNIVIDDLTSQKLEKLLDAVNVDYVLFSSENNYQAIVNVKKLDYTLEQANFLTSSLNKAFGDPNFSGANHYLRCAGFFNKKKTNNNDKSCLIDFSNRKDKTDNKCYFDSLLSKHQPKTSNTASSLNFDTIIEDLSEEKAKVARKEIMAEIALCKKKFKVLDWSAIDFRIVKRLYRKGLSENEIAVSLIKFTDFEDRHSDPKDYLRRTITNAINR